MHSILIEKLAETLVADRLREAERRRQTGRGDNGTTAKGWRDRRRPKVWRTLDVKANDAAAVESCPAGCTPH